jgi:outer membrane receptor for ferrienterochelin and colicins
MHDIIKLAQRLEGNTLVYKYINIYYYQTTGGNLNFKYRFYPDFSFNVGLGTTGSYYSFDKSKSGFNDFKFSTDISTSVYYSIRKIRTKLALFYKYSDKVINFDIDENNNITQGFINSYHTLDISATREHFLSDRLTLTFGGKNLFNNTNILSSGAASGGVHTSDSGSSPVGWGRTFFISLIYQFAKF